MLNNQADWASEQNSMSLHVILVQQIQHLDEADYQVKTVGGDRKIQCVGGGLRM